MPVIFIPFILAGALWLLFTGAKQTAYTARKKAALGLRVYTEQPGAQNEKASPRALGQPLL